MAAAATIEVPKLAPSAASAVSADLEDRVLSRQGVTLSETHLAVGHRYRGKVRDLYDLGDHCLLVATDRQSAFDRSLAVVPLKGAVLNQISCWWFKRTEHIVPNHVVKVVDPNAVLVRKCDVFPIEVVVRGFITGSTSTSLWTHYNAGAREYCGVSFPDGLRKNDRLAAPVLTPTTKEAVHDRPIAPADIVAEGWMVAEDWAAVSELALKLFEEGQRVAAEHGLLLVDTKYEFGRDPSTGQICLVDEVHTPDSSRFWLAASYEERHAAGQEPENVDKEFLRLWFRKACDPYADAALPAAPAELVAELSKRYVLLHEMITGERFDDAAAASGPPSGSASTNTNTAATTGGPEARLAAVAASLGEQKAAVVAAVSGSHARAAAGRKALAAHPAVSAGEAATEGYVCTGVVALGETAASLARLVDASMLTAVLVAGADEAEAEGASFLTGPAIQEALIAAGVPADTISIV